MPLRLLRFATLAASALGLGRGALGRLGSLRRAATMTGLETLAGRADCSWVRCLDADPDAKKFAPNKESRQVRSGHYVPVRPSKLPSPELLLHSPELAADLGLSEGDVKDPRFARFFSGDFDALPFSESWATPYALSIMGTPQTRNCPFGTGNGYGDGRAVSVGEVLVDSKRYEFQLKGGGRTPFCRGADGRAVLRSSLREFLASEAMHFLGVPTTRALSLVGSSETTQRPWYSQREAPEAPDISEDDPRLAQFPLQLRRQLIRQLRQERGGSDPDVMVSERCAITCRVAPSFTRVGHVDLFARRAAGGGDAERKALAALVQHAVAREFPDLLAGAGDATQLPPLSVEELRPVALKFAERARDALAALAAGWLRVGFCQGNFNADNCLVGGRTMDYGPFGFVDKYDPGFAKWVGSGEHFAFAAQPAAALANYGTLVRSLAPLFDDPKELRKLFDTANTHFQAAVDETYARKLGLAPGAEATALWRRLEPLLRGLDYTVFFRLLSRALAADDAVAAVAPSFYGEPKEGLAEWLRDWKAAVGDPQGVAARMDAVNPKYILREWMLVEAYEAAGAGDLGLARELHALVKEPYAEQPAMEAKYFRRAPDAALGRPGTAWMT